MESTSEQVLLRYEDPGEFLLNELQKLCSDNSSPLPYCDVFLICKDKEIVKAHSAVLAVISPYMELILSEVWDSQYGVSLILPDFNGRDIKNLIQFIYTGKIYLSEKEFDIFQQMILELQISTDDSRAIILEEIPPSTQETQEMETMGLASYESSTVCSQSLELISSKNIESNQIMEHSNSCSKKKSMPAEHQKNAHKDFGPEHTKNQKDDDSGNEIIIEEVELILDDPLELNPRKSKPAITCELCPSIFSSQSKLSDHMLKHTGERPFKCQLCDKSYPVKATLTAHLRLHADDKPHQCERCGKAFLIRSLLDQHLRTHTDERPFVCNVCGKAFRNQSNLIGHKKTHTGDRPHLCSICHKSFNRRHDLDAHLRIHSGEKPFACSLCPKSFRFRSALRVHMKGVHKTTI